jgi:hypothetical protein
MMTDEVSLALNSASVDLITKYKSAHTQQRAINFTLNLKGKGKDVPVLN